MNMKYNDDSDIEALFNSLDDDKTEEDLNKEESYILQANYLSEIERLYKDGGLNRRELAFKINLSPSYLSQVFGGDKPLNFLTLAKIKRALDLRFDLRASFASEKKIEVRPYMNLNESNNFEVATAKIRELNPRVPATNSKYNSEEVIVKSIKYQKLA